MNKQIKATICIVAVLAVAITGHAQYNEQDIRDYIDRYADVAVQKMNEYKIPASITIAQGIFESACGKSRLAVEGNNHFGIKCHEWEGDTILIDDDELQECFRKYASVEDSYNDHSLFLTNRKRYSNLFQLDIMDYQSWARTLKQDGYATNPQYADRLISLIERFNIARLDTLYQQTYGSGNSPLAAGQSQTKPTQPSESSSSNTKPKPTGTEKPGKKVFTAIGSEYPSDQSPFTYRKVFKNNNTYFVIAEKGDTYEKIAQDILVMADNLRKFNDAGPDDEPVENESVYVEAKARGYAMRIHTVQAGETLRYISQRYGVQLHLILKYNMLEENAVIHPGDQILLRR